MEFHSLRRCFATYLDRAQGISRAVNPSVIAELMGHKKETLALSLYSGGQRLAERKKAIDALSRAIEPDVLKALQATPGNQQAA